MQHKLKSGRALDVSKIGRPHPDFSGVWVLDRYQDDIDYCVAESEQWIWSIGRDSTGIYAATDGRFYQNPAFECLWLR